MGEIHGYDPNDEQPPSEENRIETNEPSPAFLDFQERLENGAGEINSKILEESFKNKEITAQEYSQLLQVYVKKVELRAEKARLDTLTGVNNLLGFNEKIEEIVADLQYPSEHKRKLELQSVMVVALDMNFLKTLNDMYGHHAGDVGIMALANLLRKSTSGTKDTVARIGGDEFLVIIPIDDESEGIHERIFERLMENISNLKINFTSSRTGEEIKAYEIHTAAGYSVLTKNDSSKTVETLRNEADKALYDNKEAMKQQTN